MDGFNMTLSQNNHKNGAYILTSIYIDAKLRSMISIIIDIIDLYRCQGGFLWNIPMLNTYLR